MGLHPFADTFLKKTDLSEGESVYPLVCDLCEDCGNVQLQCITKPEGRYVEHDYSYTSSNSNFSKNHWINYAKEVSQKVDLKSGLVVEIGSNDGFLSEQFLTRGNKVLGVDPSPYVTKLAQQRGVTTHVELFGSKSVSKILQIGKAELVVANNVLNHSDNPVDFVNAVSQILDDEGTFVYELPYWLSSVESGKFDQIYHEHVSYLNVRSSKKLLKQAGLKIVDIQVVDYHGGSLRIYAKHASQAEKVSEKVEKLEKKEVEFGLFNLDTYSVFMKNLKAARASFLKRIYQLKEENKTIIAVGAAAKGNTLLNFYGIDNKIVDYVTDTSKHKQNKYTPYTRIPICSDDVFKEYYSPYALILSWNLSTALKESLTRLNQKIQFVNPWEKNKNNEN